MTDADNIAGRDIVGDVYGRYGKRVLERLLEDKTTGENIVWATDSYEQLGDGFRATEQIKAGSITGFSTVRVQPRVAKSVEDQVERTRIRAEVFTPTWLVCQMNNGMDAQWFGRPDVLLVSDGTEWHANLEQAAFPDERDRGWRSYVDATRLEVGCVEAPFICTRYDAATGETIPVIERVGFLDRKLRVVSENATDEAEWLKWATRALESSYGFEYQGDNLLLGRCNVLLTYIEHLETALGREATKSEALKAANIIAWNLWQMDAFTDRPPKDKLGDERQLTFWEGIEVIEMRAAPLCKIYDWRKRVKQTYESLKRVRPREHTATIGS